MALSAACPPLPWRPHNVGMAASGDGHRPAGGVTGSSGVQSGDGNVQYNYFGGSRAQVPLERRLTRVRDLDSPIDVGVHPALAASEGDPVFPEYVQRDLAPVLGDLVGVSRFVVVIGESTAGKTRLAYEVMRSRLPGHVFIWPTPSELEEALALALRHRDSVIWLDDLERYLGADGLAPEMLSPVLAAVGHHTVVLATMRTSQRAAYSPRQLAGSRAEEGRSLVLAGRVLELAREVRLDRMWSAPELGRAARAADSRVARAIERAGEFGVAQYLAAAPELLRRWQYARGSRPDGHPRGYALVAAATDAWRAGYRRGIPLDVLRRLHDIYLRLGTDRYARLESWDEALTWATTAVYSTSSLLLPDGDDCYIAFDYLVDAVDDAVPVAAWEEIVSFAPAEDAIDVAWMANSHSRPRIAEAALRKALDAGYAEAALDFAIMAPAAQEPAVVQAWLERALSAPGPASPRPEVILELRSQLAWWTGARFAGSGDPRKARDLALSVVEDSTRILGPRHPITLLARITLARQLADLDQPAEALAIATDVASTVPDPVQGYDVGRAAQFEVAVATRDCGDLRAVIALYQALVEELVAEQNMSVDAVANMGHIVDELSDAELDAQVLAWLEGLFNSLGEVRADLYVRLGWLLAWWTGGREENAGDYARAGNIAQQVIDDGTEALGPDDGEVLIAKAVLAQQIGKLGDPARALAIATDVADTAIRLYGPAHRATVDATTEVKRWGSPADQHPAN
jgi:eukaryotic-like serine/threonine-protein kinase